MIIPSFHNGSGVYSNFNMKDINWMATWGDLLIKLLWGIEYSFADSLDLARILSSSEYTCKHIKERVIIKDKKGLDI